MATFQHIEKLILGMRHTFIFDWQRWDIDFPLRQTALSPERAFSKIESEK